MNIFLIITGTVAESNQIDILQTFPGSNQIIDFDLLRSLNINPYKMETGIFYMLLCIYEFSVSVLKWELSLEKA